MDTRGLTGRGKGGYFPYVPGRYYPRRPVPRDLPLRGYVRLYEASLKGENKSPKTIQVYLYVLGRFHDWLEASYGATPVLAYFTLNHVRLFLAAALERPKWDGYPFMRPASDKHISSSTLHQYVRTLKTFGSWLAREGYTPTHMLYVLRLPKVEEKQLVPLTEEEERQLIGSYDDNVAADCRIKAIFLLMLDTGLRLSELVHLQDANVDLDHGFLLVMGKGRKERSVPFGYTTERVLRKYVTFFRPQTALPNIGEFFLSPDGHPLSKKALEMVFVRAPYSDGHLPAPPAPASPHLRHPSPREGYADHHAAALHGAYIIEGDRTLRARSPEREAQASERVLASGPAWSSDWAERRQRAARPAIMSRTP